MNPLQNTPEDKKQNPKKIVGVLLMEAGLEFAFLIAGPLVAGIFSGKWLDAKFNTHFFCNNRHITRFSNNLHRYIFAN